MTRICVSYYVAGEYKEKGFRGLDAEERAKAFAAKQLANPKVDNDGQNRVDSVSVFTTSADGEDTTGQFIFDDVTLNGWKFMELDG